MEHKNLEKRIGFIKSKTKSQEDKYKEDCGYVNLKLAARGMPVAGEESDYPFLEISKALMLNFQERLRLLKNYLSPVDQYVSDWIREYVKDTGVFSKDDLLLPNESLILERHGLARTLSLPLNEDYFESDIISSYRVSKGVCHNPKSDKRTTKGVFHVTEGGLPIAADKLSVPVKTFAIMLKNALNPPKDLMLLPFTNNQDKPVHTFVSLLLRPVISPEVPGFSKEKTMETRFFAPGNLVSNLDFVESIFGNAGDPFLPENDARLDVEHWSGHTGCVILAPHLIKLKKKDVGLPHESKATELQRKQGMCWEDEDELYNNGSAFKLTARDTNGVVVTLIADNYFGYCKKEVKTQISYATNLDGLSEEEHAGGALVFPSFDLGESFSLSDFHNEVDHSFKELVERSGDEIDVKEEGYAIDKRFDDILYIPEDSLIDLNKQSITWNDGKGFLSLSPKKTYVLPSGYKVEMKKPSAGQRWRLVGTTAEGTFCHKPCTVSGGGKSEISKSLSDAMQEGPVIMPKFDQDMYLVEELLKRDYSDRYKDPKNSKSRGIFDPTRSLGSVMRLFLKSDEFTDEYNKFISTIPHSVRDFILTLKRYWKPDWGNSWKDRFRVDTINGKSGYMLKYRLASVMTSYLRVGYALDGTWRMFELRKDFAPAKKLQREDDISASLVVPSSAINSSLMHPDVKFPSYKFVKNCEYRLFQRPDEAIHRGYDKQTELDFSKENMFFSNYDPKTRDEIKDVVSDDIRFDYFTKPMKDMMLEFVNDEKETYDYAISSAHPRIVNGKPTENPRYLQNRPDLDDYRSEYLGDLGARLYRRIPFNEPVLNPVHAVLVGRRNNPMNKEIGIRSLAVYAPIHYQELPELFMDFIASLTGKSPSTTGAGSEGALTKGPFNALLPILDLNAALVSYLVTDSHGFSTAAGYVGPNYRVDHDISLVVPEIWSRMFLHERTPEFLIKEGHLEKIDDIKENGEVIHASRLGYRITDKFVEYFLGRVFSEPNKVFTNEILRPEEQSYEEFIDGVKNISETHKKIALNYFSDGGIDIAIPPLKAILNIMAYGSYEGKTIHDKEVRDLFKKENVIQSQWYKDRITAKVRQHIKHLENNVSYLKGFLNRENYEEESNRLKIFDKLKDIELELDSLRNSPSEYENKLKGTIGVEPSFY